MSENISQAPPFDRSPKNGFRCVIYLDPDKIPAETFQQVMYEETPDFYKKNPVPESIFQVYKDLFSYDKTDLNAVIEESDTSSEDWIKEKITFDAAYGNERMIAYLFLPKKNHPPYQTVIYFPGIGASWQPSSENLENKWEFKNNLSFIVKNDRAVLYPVYKGTYERKYGSYHNRSTHQGTEYHIKLVKDIKKSIDYLETRPDIDIDKLAYYGFSWGGWLGNIIPAVEERLKVSIIHSGGIPPWEKEARPEVNVINFISRIKIPTLMLSGKYDYVFPYEISVKPMYDLLGTPKKDKLLKLYDRDHFVPRKELIKESLDWLDKYLGPVK